METKELILSKHVDFIASYGKTHDVYVILTKNTFILILNELNFKKGI